MVFAGAMHSSISRKYLHGVLPRAVFPVFINSSVCTPAYAIRVDIYVLLADAILKE